MAQDQLLDPVLPEVDMHLVMPGDPVVGRIVANESCMCGKSASYVHHIAIDVSGTPLEGHFRVGQAFGVIAQSVGGGGGRINFFIGQEPTRAPLPEPETASSRVRTAGTRASTPSDFSLGATGGTGLDGGDVTMTLTGEVMTSGDGALGLFYQSVGAGGGQLNRIPTVRNALAAGDNRSLTAFSLTRRGVVLATASLSQARKADRQPCASYGARTYRTCQSFDRVVPMATRQFRLSMSAKSRVGRA